MNNLQQQLHEILLYDPDTGVFTWKVTRGRQAKAQQIAGTVDSNGYRRIAFNGRRVRAHRLAWLYVYGVWPTNYVDHANGDKLDNRLSNLREATHQQNQQNGKAYKTNTSGFKGVTWFKRLHKWRAAISLNGKTFHIGYFEDITDAATAYNFAAATMHGEFACYNQVEQGWLAIPYGA